MTSSALQPADERKPRTIVEAITMVMLQSDRPLSHMEIYERILAQRLYEFHAERPDHVVQAQIRRHCVGLDFPSANVAKHFQMPTPGFYELVQSHKKLSHASECSSDVDVPLSRDKPTASQIVIEEIKSLTAKHTLELRNKILDDLRGLPPAAFEDFGRRILEIYGFHDVMVTQISRDGGLDGYGKLRVGLATLNVAFQSKRFRTQRVTRTEVDKFRGAIQGEYEQGVFFTTSRFTRDAISASIRRGAVPIVLIDADGILDIMMQHGFGIAYEQIQIPIYSLDLEINHTNV